MNAAKRKWAKRARTFMVKRKRQGENAAYDWLKRFNPVKVKKYVFA